MQAVTSDFAFANHGRYDSNVAIKPAVFHRPALDNNTATTGRYTQIVHGSPDQVDNHASVKHIAGFQYLAHHRFKLYFRFWSRERVHHLDCTVDNRDRTVQLSFFDFRIDGNEPVAIEHFYTLQIRAQYMQIGYTFQYRVADTSQTLDATVDESVRRTDVTVHQHRQRFDYRNAFDNAVVDHDVLFDHDFFSGPPVHRSAEFQNASDVCTDTPFLDSHGIVNVAEERDNVILFADKVQRAVYQFCCNHLFSHILVSEFLELTVVGVEHANTESVIHLR